MTIRDIAEVRTRLDDAVAARSGDVTNPAELLDITEQLSIQMLDSEHDCYPPGHLQELLMSYLYIRQIELGLLPCPAPEEV